MSTNDIKDSEILAVKDGLLQLGEAIETIANRELPAPEIPNRSLSGDKIQGGKIAQFSSAGIRDEATKQTLVVKDEGMYVDNINVAIYKSEPNSPLDVTYYGEKLLEPGIHSLRVLATDIRGNKTLSELINFTVANESVEYDE